MTKDRELLPIFFTEHQNRWAHQSQQATHNGGDTVEMPRSTCTAQRVLQAAWNSDPKNLLNALGIDLTVIRTPDRISASFCGHTTICFEIPGISGEVFARTKLQWVDVNAGQHRTRPFGQITGAGHQGGVPSVETSHRWHEVHRQRLPRTPLVQGRR